MADRSYTLQPIVGKGKVPLERVAIDGILGTEKVRVYTDYLNDYLKTPGLWCLESLQVDIVTDATVANRTLISGVDDPKQGYVFEGIASDPITASLTRQVHWGHFYDFANMLPANIAASTGLYAGIAEEYNKFSGDEFFYFQVYGGVAGDIYNFHATFKCLNRKYGLTYAKRDKGWCC